MILCWAAFIAILGCGLDTPAGSRPTYNPGCRTVGGKAKEHCDSLYLPLRIPTLRSFLNLLLLPLGCPPQCLG